jgi:hypothetical protein
LIEHKLGVNELYQEVVQLTLRYKRLAAIQRKVIEKQKQKLNIPIDIQQTTSRNLSQSRPPSTLSKIVFPSIKYKNQDEFPDYFKLSLEELLKSENSTLSTKRQEALLFLVENEKKEDEKWIIFIHNTQTNEVLLFEDVHSSICIEELKVRKTHFTLLKENVHVFSLSNIIENGHSTVTRDTKIISTSKFTFHFSFNGTQREYSTATDSSL